jgi:hypothetical protein
VATFKIQGSDGKEYTVNAPEGTNEEDLKAAVENKIASAGIGTKSTQVREARKARIKELEELQKTEDAAIEDYDPGVTSIDDDFLASFGRGFKGVAETGALGALELIPNQLISAEKEDAVRDEILAVGDWFEDTASSIAPGWIGKRVQNEDSIASGIGNALGSVAGFIAPAAAATYLAPAIGLGGLATALGLGTTALLGVTGAAGEQSERARAAGATRKQRARASLTAAPIGLTELIPIQRFLPSLDLGLMQKLGDKLGPEFVDQLIKEKIPNALISAGVEGGQEVAANVLQNLTEKQYNDINAFAGTAEAGGYGGAAGFITQLLGDTFLSKRKRKYLKSGDIEEAARELAADDEAIATDTSPEVSTSIEEQIDALNDLAERGEINPAILEEAKLQAADMQGQEEVQQLKEAPVTETSTVVNLLDEAGVKPQAAIRKRLKNITDVNDPKVKAEIEKYKKNNRVPENDRIKLEALFEDKIKTKEPVTEEPVTEPSIDKFDVEKRKVSTVEGGPDVRTETVDTTVDAAVDTERGRTSTEDTGRDISPETTTTVDGGELDAIRRRIASKLDAARADQKRLDTTQQDVDRTNVGERRSETPLVAEETADVRKEPTLDTTKTEVKDVKKEPFFDDSARSLTQEEALTIYGLEKRKGKTDEEATKVVQEEALSREVNALRKEGISEEAINTRIQEAGLGAPTDTSVTPAETKPRLEIADDKPSIKDVEARDLKIADDKTIIPQPKVTRRKKKATKTVAENLGLGREAVTEFETPAETQAKEEAKTRKIGKEEFVERLAEREEKAKEKAAEERKKRPLTAKDKDADLTDEELEAKIFEEGDKKQKVRDKAKDDKEVDKIIKKDAKEAEIKKAKEFMARVRAEAAGIQQKVIAENNRKVLKGKIGKKEREELEKIEEENRYTKEDKIPRGYKVGDLKPTAAFVENRVIYSEPIYGRTKDGTPKRNIDIKLTDTDLKKINNLLLFKSVSNTSKIRPAEDKTGKAAARAFFIKYIEPADAIELIAFIRINNLNIPESQVKTLMSKAEPDLYAEPFTGKEVEGAYQPDDSQKELYERAIKEGKSKKEASEIAEAGAADAILFHMQHQSNTNAKLAIKWIRENLSSDARKSLNNQIKKEEEVLQNTLILQYDANDNIITQERRAKGLTEKQQTEMDMENYKTLSEYFKGSEEVVIDKKPKGAPDPVISPEIEETTIEEIGEFSPLSDSFDDNSMPLADTAVSRLGLPINGLERGLLEKGSLKNAILSMVHNAPHIRIGSMLVQLGNNVGKTKVEVVKNLKDEGGISRAGLFDPKTNTIKLDAEKGMNYHVVMHEMTHAVTSQILAEKGKDGTPIRSEAKKLNKLYNDIKDQLDTVYGSKNLDEFVAEAFSNPAFQRKLAGINTKGQPINSLLRFFNTIGNMLRRIFKLPIKPPITSALNQTDSLIKAIITISPDFRDASELGMPENLENIIKSIDEKTKSFTPKKSTDDRSTIKKIIDAVSDKLGGGKKLGARGLLATLNSQSLGDVGARYGLNTILSGHKLFERHVGTDGEMDKLSEASILSLKNFFVANKNNKKVIKVFNELVHRSTIYHVDPSRPKSDYEKDTKENKETDGEGKTKKDRWVELQPLWNVLGRDKKGKNGQQTYEEMRDSYKALYVRLKKAVDSRINDLIDDPEARKKMQENVNNMILAKGTIDPYFPLMRKGDLFLSYVANNPATGQPEPVFESYETESARQNAIDELKGLGESVVPRSSIKFFENIQSANFDKLPANAFFKSTLEILKKNNVDAEAQNELMRMFIDALPETSFAKSMRNRKDRLGFIEDAYGNFQTKTFQLGRQISRLAYTTEYQKLMTKMEDEFNEPVLYKTGDVIPAGKKVGDVKQDAIKFGPNSKAAKLVIDEMKKRISFAKNPPADSFFANLNRIAFIGTIGFNASSAIVNASQVPLMMYPILSGKYGINESTSELYKASALIAASLPPKSFFSGARQLRTLDGKTVDSKGMTGIDNFYVSDGNGGFKVRTDMGLDKASNNPMHKGKTKREVFRLDQLKTLVEVASARGQLNRSIFYDTLSLENVQENNSMWSRANVLSAWMFHQVEKHNRQVALTSTYFLELDRMNTTPTPAEKKLSTIEKQKKAADQAIYQSQEMNGGNTLVTAPRIAQQGAGRTIMMYKSYGIQMYYTMLKTAKQVFTGETASDRDTAFTQLAGIFGSSMLLAGVAGIPMFQTIALIANLFLPDDEEDFETLTRQYIGELFYKGGANHLTGVDVSSRIGLTGLLYRTNTYTKDQDIKTQLLQAMGGPAGSVITQALTGLNEVFSTDGSLERGIEKMLPAAYRNMYKGFPVFGRYAREGILTRRGDEIIAQDDITGGQLLSQIIGFAPTEWTLTNEKNSSAKRMEKAIVKKRTALLKVLYMDLRSGHGVDDILERIQKFNSKHPYVMIDINTMLRSIRQHTTQSAFMHNGVSLSPSLRFQLQNHIDNYKY